jgi:GTP:adenosylcobinamide-phosphate guanylyltransferase
MYICSTFNGAFKNNTTKEYKQLLKQVTTKQFRRVSKFNTMAIYGALSCLENKNYDPNINIYTASEYGCIEDMNKVLMQVSKKDEIVMPFDFLNINGNNVGFLISEALNTFGNNFYITAEDVSFEKAFELAYFDISINKINDGLIGAVDESLDYIENINSMIKNIDHQETHDGTFWFHLSNNNTNALAKIEILEIFTNLEELNSFLNTIQYDHLSLNLYAKQQINNLKINQNKIIPQSECFFGTYSAMYISNLLSYKGGLLHISLDEKNRAYLFYFTK